MAAKLHTSLCDALHIEKPIMSAPMAGAAGPDLVANVSNAGGFGVIPLWGRPAQAVHEGIAELRKRTDRNFAVNINLEFNHEEVLRACIDANVFAVSLFWGMNTAAIETAKAAGLVVISSVGNAEEARIAVDAGADVIVAQGWEAGGHVWGQVATMALVPAVVDAVDVPVVAAGGIADGRGMAAALMLGASGVWVGTRLLGSDEATIHETYKQSLLAASEVQSEWYADLYDGSWPDAPHRALANSTSRAWRDAGSAAPGDRPNEGAALGERPGGGAINRYQSYTPLPGTTGDVEAMSMWAGQGVGLLREIRPVAEIVEEIHSEAIRIIDSARGMLGR